MMSAIASDGQIFAPRLNLNMPRTEPTSLGISASNLALVKKGLEEVVSVNTPGARGTANDAFHKHGPELAVRVAGKTSTAQHGRASTDEKVKSHAWFVGYAPADNPQVAFAVLLEEAGHGGSAAAPVAYEFLKEIYGTRLQPKQNRGGTQ
jgi:cell division protein FtsI/penicillin-binding protein 2